MRRGIKGIALICAIALTGCGGVQEDENASKAEGTQTVTLGKASYEAPNQWETDAYEETGRYYYPDGGMVLVQNINLLTLCGINENDLLEYLTPTFFSEITDFAIEGKEIMEIGENDWLCVDVKGSLYRGLDKNMQIERFDILLVDEYFMTFRAYTKEGEPMKFEEAYLDMLASVKTGVEVPEYIEAPEAVFTTTATENGLADQQMYVKGVLKEKIEVREWFAQPVYVIETEHGMIKMVLASYRGIWDIAVGDRGVFYFEYMGFSELEQTAIGQIRDIEKE